MLKTYKGSCHCGTVRYEVDADLEQGTGKCNCSICSKSRAWSTSVKPEAFRLLSGADSLSEYQFGTKQVNILFCRNCGVRSFSRGDIPEIGGPFVSISIAALDGVEPAVLAALPVMYSDGLHNNWMNPPEITSYL